MGRGVDVVLGGTLAVSIVDGHEPALGDTFVVVDGSGVLGGFDEVELARLAGHLRLAVGQEPGEVVLVVTCPGDCTLDGVLYILDFVCFRQAFLSGCP